MRFCPKVAEATQLSRKQVASVFDALSDQIKNAVGKKGPGVFALPGLMKIMVIQKPATPKRKGINPFTKQEQIFPAKPAARSSRSGLSRPSRTWRSNGLRCQHNPQDPLKLYIAVFIRIALWILQLVKS